jgi:hypothetical protein
MEALGIFGLIFLLIIGGVGLYETGKDHGQCKEKCSYVTEFKRIDNTCYCKVEGEWKKPLECKR